MSGLFAVAAIPRGVALGIDPTNPRSFVLAQPTNFIGHVTRDVRAADAAIELQEALLGERLSDEIVMPELPFKLGTMVSVNHGRRLEVEGSDFILDSGTGLITSATALRSPLTFKDGKFAVAQANQDIYYRLSAIVTDTVVENALRIMVDRVFA